MVSNRLPMTDLAAESEATGRSNWHDASFWTSTGAISKGTGGSAVMQKAVYSPKWASLHGILQQVRRHGASSANRHWIRSLQADCFFAAAIVAHSITLGFDVELRLQEAHSQSGGASDSTDTGHIVMTWGLMVVRSSLLIIFTVELLLRSQAWGRHFLCTLNGIFDVFLVLTGWTDMALVVSGVAITEMVGVAMHACQLLRLVRMFRLFAIVPALRLICSGLAATTVASAWAVTLLVLLAYVGALLCTDILGDESAELRALYGHVPLAMLTHVKLALVEAWPDIAEPMLVHSRLWTLYLTVFMLVTNVALLNLVTGLICEKVMEIAHKQPPTSEEDRVEASLIFEQKLWRLFESVDHDRDGYLEEEDYLELLKTSKMQQLLQDQGIGLPLDHGHVLSVLDADNNGTLSFEEFIDGISRQRGTRTDHQSQSLQYDLAERTNHTLRGIACTRRSAKAASRRSFRQARRRMCRELKVHVRQMATGCEAQRPCAKEPELGLCDGLLALEDASLELRSRLRGLRSACQNADTTEARQRPKPKPRPLALEDVYLEDAPDEFDLLEAAVSNKEIKFIAGTGSIGDRSSGSGSCRGPRIREGSSGSDPSGRGGGGASAPAGITSDGSSSSGGSSDCDPSRPSSRSSSSSSSSSGGGGGRSRSRRGHERWSTAAHIGSPGSPTFGSMMPWSGASTGGVGRLHVQVLGVHGLRSSGDAQFTGSFDTYIVLRIGMLECRTPTACYSMGAAWAFGEPRCFDLRRRVPDPPCVAPPALEVEVMNVWLVSDDTLGAASLDLTGLEPGRWHRRRKRLHGRQGGELELALLFEEEAKSPVGSCSPDRPTREATPEGSRRDGEQPQSRGNTPSSRHQRTPEAHRQSDEAKSRGTRSPISSSKRGEEEGGADGSATSSGSAFPGLEKVLARRDTLMAVPKLPVSPEKIPGSGPLFAAAPTVHD